MVVGSIPAIDNFLQLTSKLISNESTGFPWTLSSGFQWILSSGFRWIPADRVQWIPADSARLLSSGDSVGLCQTCPAEKYDGIPWTLPEYT